MFDTSLSRAPAASPAATDCIRAQPAPCTLSFAHKHTPPCGLPHAHPHPPRPPSTHPPPLHSFPHATSVSQATPASHHTHKHTKTHTYSRAHSPSLLPSRDRAAHGAGRGGVSVVAAAEVAGWSRGYERDSLRLGVDGKEVLLWKGGGGGGGASGELGDGASVRRAGSSAVARMRLRASQLAS